MKHGIAKQFGRIACALSAIVLLASPASADESAIKAHLAKFKDPNVVRIVSVALKPAIAKAGSTIAVKLTVENQTNASIPAVNYQFTLPDGSSKSGKTGAIAGHGVASVTTTFVAGPTASQRVSAAIDPKNMLSEPTEQRKNNNGAKDLVVLTGSSAEWNSWATKAAERFELMVGQEKPKICVQKGVIMASALEVKGLVLLGPGQAQHQQALVAAGMPSDVANAFMQGSYKALKEWVTNYGAVFPLAFPAFVAWPGPVAPPMYAMPSPVWLGGSVGGTNAITPLGVEAFVLAQLANRKDEPGARDAVRAYSIAAATELAQLVALAVLTPLGQGQVPSYAPPIVTLGPVAAGWTDRDKSCLH